MSDELTIQGVNPQQQYPVQKTSTMPYTLGGAAIGAAAGWAGTSMAKSKGPAKTLEELVQEANGQDKVDLTTKKAALEKAEKELADAGKAVYDGAEKEALDKAIKARDEELAKLMETKAGGKEFKVKDWDKLKIDSRDLPAVNERTGKPFHTNRGAAAWENEVKTEYQRLQAEYNAAVSKFESSTSGKDSKRLETIKDDIKQYMDDAYNTHKTTKPKKLKHIFTTEKGFGKHTAEYNKAKALSKKILPELKKESQLTDSQIASFADKLEKGQKVPSGYHSKEIWEVIDGKRTKVKYAYSSDMFNEFKNAENAKYVDQRKELIDSLLDRAKANIELRNRQANFEREFIESIPDSMAEKTGLFNTVGSRKEVKIADIINEAVNGKGEKGKPKFYKSDLAAVNKAIEKNGGASTKLPATLKGHYTAPAGGTLDLQTVKDMITSRKEILESYNTEAKSLSDDIANCLKDHNVIRELDDKIAEMRNADDGIAKAKEAILKQFPQLADDVERAGLTEAQAMEKESYKKLAKIVEDKQAIYDKVAAEKGKVNETAKKTAQEAVEKAKSELDNLVNSLNNKVKGMSGKAKAAWIAGTAVAGALIGAGIVNSKNKKAEAAAKQFMAQSKLITNETYFTNDKNPRAENSARGFLVDVPIYM